ncbi:hypothetical protein [Pseudonocardia sp. T1-2H]|uniref:hypothetical protein n=1 Tax=Pseudonocardia sp. T1-2H TaxID=3128899 RepID=UPI003100F0F9
MSQSDDQTSIAQSLADILDGLHDTTRRAIDDYGLQSMHVASPIKERLTTLRTVLGNISFIFTNLSTDETDLLTRGIDYPPALSQLAASIPAIALDAREATADRDTTASRAQYLDDAISWLGQAASRMSANAESLTDTKRRSDALSRLAQAGRLVSMYSALDDITEAQREVLHVRDAARAAIGETKDAAAATGSAVLAKHYDGIFDRENAMANRLRLVTSGLLLLLTLGAGYITLTVPHPEFTAVELTRLSLALPIAVLAAYLGREAGRHRVRANWAEELAMQLRTFDAFTEPLAERQRADARLAFTSILFAQIERPSDGPERGPSVVTEAAKIIDTMKNGAGHANDKGAADAKP